MRKLSSLGLLSVLTISLFASTCLISIASAEKYGEKGVYMDVYLYFPEVGPPTPFKIESNLWWTEKVESVKELYIDEKVAGERYFFHRALIDQLDADDPDGVHQTGTYTLEMVIVWEWPMKWVPGEKSTGGNFKIYDGTGYFEGMEVHGSAWVEIATDPDYGLILIQHQEGIIQSVGPS